MVDSTAIFRSKAPVIMRKLIADLGITRISAAAILGNFGVETGGFTLRLEKGKKTKSSTGFGWAQWTGSRRADFEKWCKANGHDPYGTDEQYDAACYAFFIHEIKNTWEKRAIPALRGADGIEAKTLSFMKLYERPGVEHADRRVAMAKDALAAFGGQPAEESKPEQGTGSMWADFVGKAFTREQFAAHLATLQWTAWKPAGIVLHNTAAPTLAQWVESGPAHDARIRNLQKFYEGKGWHGGPHWFVSRTLINEFSNPLRRGTHSPTFNKSHFGIEMVGDFSKEAFDSGDGAKVRDNAVFLMAMLCKRFGFNPDRDIKLHKEDPATDHDCPGKLVRKADVIARVKAEMARLSGKQILAAPVAAESADAPAAPVALPTPGAAPADKKDAKELGIFGVVTGGLATAWQFVWGSGALRIVICLAAAFAVYWFVVRPVLRRMDALKDFYDRADLLRMGLLTRLQLALKGVKTKLWGWLLGLSGPLLGVLQYADVIDFSTMLPPVNGISAAVYVPLVLTPLLGLVNNWLRNVTTTPPGETDLAIVAAAPIENPAEPDPAPRHKRKSVSAQRRRAKPKTRKRKTARR